MIEQNVNSYTRITWEETTRGSRRRSDVGGTTRDGALPRFPVACGIL